MQSQLFINNNQEIKVSPEVGEITTNKHEWQIPKSVTASASGVCECEKWCEVCF